MVANAMVFCSHLPHHFFGVVWPGERCWMPGFLLRTQGKEQSCLQYYEIFRCVLNTGFCFALLRVFKTEGDSLGMLEAAERGNGH